MILPDVNVVVIAHRSDAPGHAGARRRLERAFAEEEVALPIAVIVGFLRVVTHPGIARTPTPLDTACSQADALLARAHILHPPAAHWGTLRELVLTSGWGGNDVPDAHLAALAVDAGATLVSADSGFRRFARLRFEHLAVTA